MKNGLLILFPGIRYGVDCPLLYYTRVAYTYAGYEVIPIDDYGIAQTDDLGSYADLAVKNLVRRLKDIDFSEYSHVVFAEKSVGTVIGPMLEDVMGIPNVYHIIYTPLDAIYSYLKPDRRIIGIAAGTADKHIEIKALRAACKKLSIPLVEIKNGGHRLEAGKDVTKDISAIAQVIASIGDPKEADRLEKKIADQKAAAQKAEAEKKAAEEKAAAEKKAAAERALAEKEAEAKKAKVGNIRKLKQGTAAAEKQIEEMMEIWLQSNVKEQSFVPKKYWSKNYKEVLRVMSLSSVYFYEEDGKILGFTGSMESTMVAICVAEGQRGRGIGSLLLNKLKDEMGVLEAIVYSKNKRALDFFNKNEFQGKDIQIENATGEETIFLTW